KFACQFFSCVPGIKPLPGRSFFMPQEDEGNLELLGTQVMYWNLCQDKLLNGMSVVGSFGIGRGSCQWMIQNKDGSYELTGHYMLPSPPENSGFSPVCYEGPSQPLKSKPTPFALRAKEIFHLEYLCERYGEPVVKKSLDRFIKQSVPADDFKIVAAMYAVMES